MKKCYLCGTDKELRPYGPKGEWVCGPCAMSTPERKRQTEQSYENQLSVCGDVAVVGLDVGPTTFKSINPLLKGGEDDNPKFLVQRCAKR